MKNTVNKETNLKRKEYLRRSMQIVIPQKKIGTKIIQILKINVSKLVFGNIIK